MTLLEEPTLILFWGALLVAILAVVWVQTQQPRVLWALGGALLAVVALLVVERLVITPREEIRAALFSIAQRLEANDVDGVLEYISTEAEGVRQQVRELLVRARVEQISIKRNLKINLSPRRPAHSAEARFNAVATLQVAGLRGDRVIVPRFVVVLFQHASPGWRVIEYEVFDPRGAQEGAVPW